MKVETKFILSRLTLAGIFVMIGMTPFLSSCNERNVQERDSSKIEERANYKYKIYEVTYKDHDYIVFEGENGAAYGCYSGQSAGVVHDPECRKCKSLESE